MLTLLGSPRRCCDGLTRRETLQAGALSILGGLTLPQYLAAREQGAGQGPAKSVIVLYLLGGAPTQDMWDLKPSQPAEVRGEFNPIATNVPGVQICEHLPRTAQWMHRIALVRSVNHKAGCHNTLPSYTGFEQPLDNIVSTKDTYPPSMGSICEYLNPDPAARPAYVYLPCYLGWGQSIRRPGPYGGFLGQAYDPLFSECNPTVDNPPDKPYYAQVLRGRPYIPNSTVANGLTLDRLDARRSLLDQFDAGRRLQERGGQAARYSREQARAWSLLTSSQVRSAFDLDQEDPALLARYGNSLFGNSALVARKLVQAGVRFVNVTWDCYWERLNLQFECWDTHARNCGILKDYNLPHLDMTLTALLEDLERHGILDETLVVILSDMGRTPKLNGNAGRDHWTFCYSVVFAGAGVRGGAVYGASDAQAAYVKENPVSTGDVCATIYQCLGIDPEMLVRDQLGRPIPIAHGGTPIHPILA